MASVLTPGITRIESAACKPEIVDLCNLLVKMGAQIENIGSPELIVTGVSELKGCQHTVIPDRIEAEPSSPQRLLQKVMLKYKAFLHSFLGAF